MVFYEQLTHLYESLTYFNPAVRILDSFADSESAIPIYKYGAFQTMKYKVTELVLFHNLIEVTPLKGGSSI